MTLLACAIAWLLAAGAAALGWSPWLALPAAALAGLGLPARTPRRRGVHGLAALVAGAAGCLALIGPAQPLPANSVGRLLGQPITLLVRAEGDGDRHPAYVGLTASVFARDGGGVWQESSGRVTATLPADTDIHDGDELQLAGVPAAPGGDGAANGYRDWLTRRGVVASLYYPALRLLAPGGPPTLLGRARAGISGGLGRVLPEREASFASALLFGGRHALPADLNDDLVRSGTAHLAVVSAFNLALLYGALLALLAPVVGRRRAAVLAMGAGVLYGTLAGTTAPVLRGEIVLALLTVGLLSGRPHSRVALLTLAAAAMTLPDAGLFGDVSFQLTFAAAFGAVILAAPIGRVLRRAARRGDEDDSGAPLLTRLADGVALSLAVTLASLPIVAGAFGSTPAYGVLANAAINPLVPLLTGLALATGVLGAVWLPAAQLVAAALLSALRAVESIAHLAAHAPGASVSFGAGGVVFGLAWYATPALASVALRLRRSTPTSRPRRPRAAPRVVGLEPGRPALALGALLLVGLATPTVALAQQLHAGTATRHTSLRWLDAKAGTLALVEGANGSRLLLVDGGNPSSIAAARSSGGIGDTALDAVVVARSDSRSADPGLWQRAARAAYGGTVLIAAPQSAPGNDQAAAPPREPDLLVVTGRAALDLGDGDRLELITDGAGAALVRLRIGGRAAIVAGGPDAPRLLDLWREPYQADLLVLPGLASERERQAVAGLTPSLILLTGSGAPPSPAGTTLLRLPQTRGLRLAATRGRLSLSYRDR